MVERLPPGPARWTVGRRFAELETAKAWGLAPHVWDDTPEESRAEMIAFEQAQSQMRRYEEWETEKRAGKKVTNG